MDLITSHSNPKIKQVRALRQRKARQESGLFIAEGIRHAGEAAAASMSAIASVTGLALDSIFYAPDLLTSEFALGLIQEQSSRGVPCYAVTAEVFASIAEKENPQGILAVLRAGKVALSALEPSGFPWMVALVAPQDPGNIGAILRTMDAAGASGLLLLESSADPYHPSAVRASMGALFWSPVVTATFEAFARWAQRHAYTVYGTSAHAPVDYREVGEYRRPAVLLLGSEREGLSSNQAAICDVRVRMPMLGRVTSLNLAVAAGVMLYAMMPGRENDR
jgi:TrmH family RNA methyltransferase